MRPERGGPNREFISLYLVVEPACQRLLHPALLGRLSHAKAAKPQSSSGPQLTMR